MTQKRLSKSMRHLVMSFQREEITEYHVYSRLAKIAKGKNKAVLQRIAREELHHYHIWKSYTKTTVKPNWWKIQKYTLLAKVFGLTFAVKLMEKGEVHAQEAYDNVIKAFPETKSIVKEEDKHEKALLAMIEEERLNYIGSMVLGLNDALVELTGALAGLSFALGKTRLIGLAGLITGIAASLSMMASEYLSKKAEKDKAPFKAAFYTGIAYIFTVLLLVVPYFLLASKYYALLFTLSIGIGIILLFTFFVAVTKDEPFGKRFWEMVIISLGVAVFSFVIGYYLNHWLNI